MQHLSERTEVFVPPGRQSIVDPNGLVDQRVPIESGLHHGGRHEERDRIGVEQQQLLLVGEDGQVVIN